MYIQNRLANAISKGTITLVAVIGLWIEFACFGVSAWRLLDTWFLLVVAVYYGVNGISSVCRKSWQGQMICPMLNGAVVAIGIGLMITQISAATGAMTVAGVEGFGCFWINFGLTILLFLDWLIFVRKGAWRVVDPWYWLALVVFYAGMIILTARGIEDLQYPYDFLNYTETRIDVIVWWMLLVSVVMLIIGYSLMLLDFTLSGELKKHIVMPRIKTVVIEEEITEPEPAEPEIMVSKKIEVVATNEKAQKTKTAKETRVEVVETGKKSDVADKKSKDKKPEMVVEGLKDEKSAQNMHGAKKQGVTKSQPKKSSTSQASRIANASKSKPKVAESKISENGSKTSANASKNTESKSKNSERESKIPANEGKIDNNASKNVERVSKKKYPKITKFAEQPTVVETEPKNRTETKTKNSQ